MADVSTIGAKIYLGNGASTEVFTSIGQITGMSALGGETRDAVDTTTMLDTIRTYIGGVRTPKAVTFDIKWDPDLVTHDETTGLLSKIQSTGNGRHNFTIEIPTATATYMHFAAIVTDVGPTASLSEVYRASITLQPSGAMTINNTAPNTGA